MYQFSFSHRSYSRSHFRSRVASRKWKKALAFKADFVVPETTLDRFALHMQFVFGDPEVRVEKVEKTCEFLVKGAGNPDFTEEDRACLYRLSDMLHFAFTEIYVTLESMEGNKSRMIPCNVPTRDAATWQNLLEDSATSAERFEEAAELLRDFFQHLPHIRAGLPQEHSWVNRASTLLATCALVMRNRMTASWPRLTAGRASVFAMTAELTTGASKVQKRVENLWPRWPRTPQCGDLG